MDHDMQLYLQPGRFIDSDNPKVIAFAREHAGNGDSRGRAVRLYYAVRDSIAYNPYRIEPVAESFRGGRTLETRHGWCVSKAALLAAAARAIGIPARIGFADVRNHLTSPRLREWMEGTDVFAYHGFCELSIDGSWVKATPAFDKALCARANVAPLEFDGLHDSLFQQFDASGRRHMEYLTMRGVFADVPFEQIIADWRALYPKVFARSHDAAPDFADELERQ